MFLFLVSVYNVINMLGSLMTIGRLNWSLNSNTHCVYCPSSTSANWKELGSKVNKLPMVVPKGVYEVNILEGMTARLFTKLHETIRSDLWCFATQKTY